MISNYHYHCRSWSLKILNVNSHESQYSFGHLHEFTCSREHASNVTRLQWELGRLAMPRCPVDVTTHKRNGMCSRITLLVDERTVSTDVK